VLSISKGPEGPFAFTTGYPGGNTSRVIRYRSSTAANVVAARRESKIIFSLPDEMYLAPCTRISRNTKISGFMSKQPREIRTAGILLSRKNNTALHRQLYEQLRTMIVKGQLRSNERVPSGRDLARELSVSRIVVTAAYEQLIIEGYLVGKTGAGTFVAGSIPDKLLQARPGKKQENKKQAATKNISAPAPSILPGGRIDARAFQIGLPSLDLFPYKTWHQCAGHVLKELKSIHLGYEDTFGYWPLRKAIASYLRISRAVTCEAEQVIVVTGSQQGLNLVARVLLKKDSCVWMEDPGYFGFKAALANIGIAPRPVPISKSGIDIAYAHKYYGPGELVYVTPSYQFPLGHTLSHQNREKLIRYASRHSMWIVEDDYDSEFRYQGNPLSSLQGLDEYRKVIYSGTFSKVLFPGLRIAYLVIPDLDLMADFRKEKEIIDRQSPILEQAILARFMEEGHFARHIRKMRLLYAQRQQYLITHLNSYCKPYLHFSDSPAGMHLRCRVKKGINIAKLKINIHKAGLQLSFVDDFAISHFYPGEFLLGYTAFTKYQLKQAVDTLVSCLQHSL